MTEMPVRIASLGVSRAVGLSGAPFTSAKVSPKIGGPPSSGVPRPLHTRPSQASPTPMRIGWPENRTAVPVVAIPEVPSSTWITARSRSRSRTTPWRTPSAVEDDLGVFVPSDTVDTRDDEKGAFDPTDVGVLDRELAAHGVGSRARTWSRCLVTVSTSAGPATSRARINGEKSTSSSSDAGTPLEISSRQRSWTTRTAIGDRGLLGRCRVAVVGTQRALLEDRFADETTGEQDHALATGKRADPDQVGDGLEPVRFGEDARTAGLGVRASWDQRGRHARRRGRRRRARKRNATSPRDSDGRTRGRGRASRPCARTVGCGRRPAR